MSSEAVLPVRKRGTRLWAAAALVVGIFVFSLQDVILKGVSGTYPLTEAMTCRASAAALILLVAVIRREGLAKLLSARWATLAFRGSIMMVAYGTYYLAFPVMKLAEVVTLFFTAPIFITALAHPLLGERVSLSHWLAILIGFGGVIVAYWPTLGFSQMGAAGGYSWTLLLPVIAAFTYALPQLMARRLGPVASAAVMGFYQNFMYLVWSLILAVVFALGSFVHPDTNPALAFLMRPWVFGNWEDIALLIACGPISAVGTVLLSQAYRMAEANFVAAFEYSALVWAASWGFLFWGEVPDLYMLAGAALIIGAGIYMLMVRREGVV
ncbi:MAG TPA: DMT family transporter [Candidatus Binatia bacterium]|nr:DMT family transporter [Candidatus Binatia bacterium]